MSFFWHSVFIKFALILLVDVRLSHHRISCASRNGGCQPCLIKNKTKYFEIMKKEILVENFIKFLNMINMYLKDNFFN